MNQAEHFRQIRNMKLCKCGVEIPISQKDCYGCWRSRTRKAEGKSYAGYFVKPAKWHNESLYKENSMNPQILDTIGETHNVEFTKNLREDRTSEHLISEFSEKQAELYRLINPYGKDLTLKDAAIKLNKSIQGVRKMYDLMKEINPGAFMYEKVIERIIGGSTKDIQNIYDGYKKVAAKNGIPFDISLDDLETIIKCECSKCGKDGQEYATNRTKGNKFLCTKLWRDDKQKGYNFINLIPICQLCFKKKMGKSSLFVIR